MSTDKKEQKLQELCRQLGEAYIVCNIDLQRCIYRDFGDGFNVEISGLYTTREDATATITLWFGYRSFSCMEVKVLDGVPQERIREAVEQLRADSLKLKALGCDNRDALWNRVHPELNPENTALCRQGLQNLQRRLGEAYSICRIDGLEWGLCREFGNEFRVEVSGVYTPWEDTEATLLLCFQSTGGCDLAVKKLTGVKRRDIPDTVERMQAYARHLADSGRANPKAILDIWKHQPRSQLD